MLQQRVRAFGASPLGRRITRYTLGSVVALVTSIVVFALLYDMGVGTTPASVAAFLAGAVPNWVLNRRWAWNVRGRVKVGREVIGYAAISVLALLASSAGTAWTHHVVRGVSGHGLRVVLVTLSYVAVQVILFGVKFLAYDLWVFSERSRVRAAFRSRHQVWVAARANRMP
jgi:putative flippase GtrA